MSFTDQCDIYCAVHENGINRLIARAMRFFPSFFNYGSPFVCAHPRLWRSAVNADASVAPSGDPLMTSVPLSLPATVNLPMNIKPIIPDFCAQLTALAIDFFPGNAITPPASFPALSSRQFGLKATVQAGLSCPNLPKEAEVLNCFSIDIFGEIAFSQSSPTKWLAPRLVDFDIQGVGPDGLKAFLDCYAIFITNQALDYIGALINGAAAAPYEMKNLYGTVSLSISPSSVGNNPVFQDDQVKLFADLSGVTINEVIGPSGSTTPGSKLAPAVSHVQRTRPSSGPSDLTVAISQSVFAKIFGAMLSGGVVLEVPTPPWPTPPPPNGWGLIGNSKNFGYLYFKVKASLQSGIVSLQNNGTVLIKDLEISWDTLEFTVNFNIPTVGPFGVGDLKIGPFFGNNPDISIPIVLSGDFSTKVSAVARPVIYYGQGDINTPNCPNRWQLYLVPQLPLFVMPIEINAKFIDAVIQGVKKAFQAAHIPDEATDIVIEAIKAADGAFQGFDTTAESLLDAFFNGIGSQMGITRQLDNMLYDYFANKAPLFELPDPLRLSLADKNTHRPANTLAVPIDYLGVSVNARELVIEGDIGA